MSFPKLKPIQSKSRPGTWVVSVPASISNSGKKESPTFRSKNTALEWATRFKDERLNGKKATSSSAEEQEALSHFRQHVGDLSLMSKVVTHWLTTSAAAVKPKPVAEVVTGFLNWRQHQGLWEKSTEEDTRGRLRIFAQFLGDRLIHELAPADIEGFLNVRGEPGTRLKYFNKLRPVFEYAKRNRFVALNPMEEMLPPVIDYREVQFYTAEELRRMLPLAEKYRPEIVPFIALLAFGFVRTEELTTRFSGDVVLDWTAFDQEERRIFVPHAVAKKAKKGEGNDRQIPFNDALMHWLEPYMKTSGPVMPMSKVTASRAFKRIRDLAGVKDLINGLRHSCLTMWMAADGDESINKVSRWSGNSPSVCKRHYVATVKAAQGKAWFGLRRD